MVLQSLVCILSYSAWNVHKIDQMKRETEVFQEHFRAFPTDDVPVKGSR
jgi:hypothetical protein